MTILTFSLTALLVLDSIVLLIVILIQRGKGGGLSSAFGGMGGETAFGTRAATTAKKATVVLSVLFIVLTAGLGYARRPAPLLQGPASPSAPVLPLPGTESSAPEQRPSSPGK